MQLKDFYKLSTRILSSAVQAHAIGYQTTYPLEAQDFPFDKNKLVFGEYKGILFPVVFRQAYGKKWQDMLRTGWHGLYLISTRMRELLEAAQLSGWQSYPIVLQNKWGEEVRGYHGFSITGRCGPVDYSKGEMIEKRLFPDSPLEPYLKGWHIPIETWDGKDFFIPEGAMGIVLSPRAYHVLKEAPLTNMAFENLAERDVSIATLKILGKL